jgi:hypothetical protein
MIESCFKEFLNLDLSINAKKSACIRIGRNFKEKNHELVINETSIPWSNHLVYLGITITSASKFSINLKTTRTKFYRSFNALYGKVFRSNEHLIISLMNSFCISTVMYSLEAFMLNNTCLRSLDNLLHNAFGKVFKTFDKVILINCMFFTGTLTIGLEYTRRRVKYLSGLHKSINPLLLTWWNINGKQELHDIYHLNNIDLSNDSNNYNIDKIIWNIFKSKLAQ